MHVKFTVKYTSDLRNLNVFSNTDQNFIFYIIDCVCSFWQLDRCGTRVVDHRGLVHCHGSQTAKRGAWMYLALLQMRLLVRKRWRQFSLSCSFFKESSNGQFCDNLIFNTFGEMRHVWISISAIVTAAQRFCSNTAGNF